MSAYPTNVSSIRPACEKHVPDSFRAFLASKQGNFSELRRIFYVFGVFEGTQRQEAT